MSATFPSSPAAFSLLAAAKIAPPVRAFLGLVLAVAAPCIEDGGGTADAAAAAGASTSTLVLFVLVLHSLHVRVSRLQGATEVFGYALQGFERLRSSEIVVTRTSAVKVEEPLADVHPLTSITTLAPPKRPRPIVIIVAYLWQEA